MTLKISNLLKLICLCIYAWFCWLMLQITLQYSSFNTDVAFLRIKQEYTSLLYYRIAFFIHVFSAILVLLAGFTQFFSIVRKKFPALHVLSGRVYVFVVLLLAAPSGLVIGIYANGGILSRVAFCMLAILWWWFTFKGFNAARNKNVFAHRSFMIRSFALALSAITLRAWKYLIVFLFHPKPMDAYRIVAWLGWTLNLLIAEIIIYKFLKNKK